MAEKSTNSRKNTHVDLRIEPALVEQIRSIVERRDFIQALMQKAQDAEANIKPTIRAKVVADYEQRLQEVMTEFEPICEQISRALSDIEKREIDIRTKLEEVNDQIEEQRFRCELGEFSKQDLEPLETEKSKARAELEEKIEVIEETYAECKKYISQETFDQATRGGPTPESEPKPTAEAEPRLAAVPEPELAAVPKPKLAAVPELEPEPEPEPEPPMPQGDEVTVRGSLRAAAAAAPAVSSASPSPNESAAVTKKEPPPVPAEEQGSGPRIKLITAGGESQYFPLDRGKIIVGRHQSSDIVLRVAGVSRKHAEITCSTKGEIKIEDISSGGGFSINGKRKKAARLKGGDLITIGPYTLEVMAD